MDSKQKLLSMISMSRKAGKLVMGFDTVKENTVGEKMFLLIATQDASPKTRKEVRFLAEKANVPMCEVPFSMDEMKKALGKRIGVLGIADKGLSEAVFRLYEAVTKEDANADKI